MLFTTPCYWQTVEDKKVEEQWGWKDFMKGPNLYHEAIAHINKFLKLISIENTLEENPKNSFGITAALIFWGMSMCM